MTDLESEASAGFGSWESLSVCVPHICHVAVFMSSVMASGGGLREAISHGVKPS